MPKETKDLLQRWTADRPLESIEEDLLLRGSFAERVDGEIGAHTHSDKDCDVDFRFLAEAILEKLEPITPA